jgi:integrase/recombinase XerD
MSGLERALDEYLALRRALGFELRRTEWALRRFVDFAEREGAHRVTTDLALRWATLPAHVQESERSVRLGTVRRFAEYLRTTDPRTEVPPVDLLPSKVRRPQPYIYSDDEILRLIRAARALPSPTGLRAWTYATLLGLLAVTGLRHSEALALDRGDVDLDAGVLTVRRGKCRKARLVPVHTTTCEQLERYARRRDRVHRTPRSDAFLVSERGLRLVQATVQHTFVVLSRQIGLRAPARSHGHGPRIHDLRHRLAVTTLMRWYQAGVVVDAKLPVLATYLGHTKVSDTYWYLSAVPELMHLAMARFDRKVRMS